MPDLHYEQTVPLPLEEAFRFFENPYNLLKITPANMALTVTNPEPVVMRQGAEITYRLRVAGVPQKWRTLITEYDPPHKFVDVQLQGPYRKWEHTLRAQGDSTLIIDDIEYELPFGMLGQLGAGWFVKRQVAGIFAYRSQVIEQLLGKGSPFPS